MNQFNSRRSVVHSPKGIVTSTQPLASAAGLRILEQGGNAAMAAVAVAAAIGLTEPMSNGIGGDAFALYYDAKTQKVLGFNGSGKAPDKVSIDLLRKDGVDGARIPTTSIHSVTVPGAVASWEDVVNTWGNGKLSLEEIITPAIELAENGFPVHEICANAWKNGLPKLKKASDNYDELLINGETPKSGEIFVNKNIAKVMKRIAKEGKKGFYTGETAQKIVDIVEQKGGFMTLEDLANHETKFLDPIGIDFEGVRLSEIPPNGQGIVALQALGTISQLAKQNKIDISKLEHNSAEYIHLVAESLKFAFKDAEEYVTDVDRLDYDPNDLLNESYLESRAALFDANTVNHNYDHGVLDPKKRSDTVYFTVSDSEGNACSFITSLYTGFGSGIIPAGCGFPLQNRGSNFNLTPGTRNALEGGKRPYHTIIPGMITNKDGSLYAAYGVMGGFMQPQGHVQVLNNMVLFGMSAQEALDAPRVCLTDDPDYEDSGLGSDSPVSTLNHTILGVEDGIPDEVIAQLEKLGHKTKKVVGNGRGLFGRGQVIKFSQQKNGIVWSGGSDPRGDGAALAQLY